MTAIAFATFEADQQKPPRELELMLVRDAEGNYCGSLRYLNTLGSCVFGSGSLTDDGTETSFII
jgi:hypothetical protein